ncbi:transglycosylase domain-containing protein [Enterovirga sp.]|uniref:transglycosylase domain-containing protein n=1 Tax=Enterovirga sp. TaxID=2026350 RepID=UPI00261565A4|nr:PBP1A family penicillin-binding protein [Enterovirga sp.]
MRAVGAAAVGPVLLAVRGGRFALACLDEAVTVLAFGLAGLLVLAQPAFRDTGPGWLKRLDLSVTFLDRDGRHLGHRGIRHDDQVAVEELPPHLEAAILATEDRRFYTHAGIDPVGLVRALVANARADAVVQGGSTITQQLAKNLFLSGERSLERKIREAFLAVWLEHQLTKRQILKLYLDRAYMGAGAFGIEAAAQVYFGVSARHVSVAQAAMLAGLLKAPSRYAPHSSPDAARARAEEVLDRMLDTGAINPAERQAARSAPAALISPERGSVADHYLDWAFREVQRLAASGRFGRHSVLTVTTALDRTMQSRAEAKLGEALARDGARFGVRDAAFVAMAPDGAVIAMIGGRDYAASQFNRASDALRQPGSAFKPFVYAAALIHTGLRPTSAVQDAEICLGSWCPSNYARGFSGTMSLASALARSVNTVAVRLSVDIGRAAGELTMSRQARFGRARIVELARALGLTTRLHDTPSLPLGASEVTLVEMTGAYAGFAAGGLKAEPHAVLAVRSASGEQLYLRRGAARPRALPAEVAAEMNAMLRKVVDEGTARRAAIPGHAAGGKTGTTSAYRDAWFVGFTGHLVAGVWFGNDDDRPTRQLTGGSLPAQLWHDVMAPAHADLAPRPLPGSETGMQVAGRVGRGFVEEVASASVRTGAARRGFEVLSGPR